MSANSQNWDLRHRFCQRWDRWIDYSDMNILRRAQMTLHRWCERECGDGSSWYIERDETTGKTYNVNHETGRRYRCPDLETGALNRIQSICSKCGLHWYYQTDPRGCALYISPEPLNCQNYSSKGFPVVA